MNYGNLPENGEDKEILNVEDEKLRSMLLNLNRVDAPKNFDFALKAKIAGAETNAPRKSALFPVLRYAVPFCLLILFAGFVVFNLFFSTDASAVPQIVEVKSALPKIQISPENSTIAVPNTAETPNSNFRKEEIAAVPKISRKSVSNNSSAAGKSNGAPRSRDEEDDFRTRDSALRESKIIFPNGIDPNKKIAEPEDFTNQKQHKISEILRQIGIETDADWRVKSVKQNSLADRSGVKNGDVIEAIDEQTLTPETVFAKSSSGKTLHLLRDGRKIAAELGKP